MTRENLHCTERIVQDPQVMMGKPVIKGTRITVELVLGQLATNPNLAELFAAYPHLTIEDVQACLAYARAAVVAKGTRAAHKVRLAAPATPG